MRHCCTPNILKLFSAYCIRNIITHNAQHPYTAVAEAIVKTPLAVRPRVLGLTASPTYAVVPRTVLQAIGELCVSLRIDKIHTASQEELQASGYHALPSAVVSRLLQ
jgi:hypothetical protein